MRAVRTAAVVVLLTGLLAACAAREPVMTVSSVDVQGLTGSQWLAEDVEGGGVVDGSHSTLEFAAADKVAGDTGCNRFMGPLAVEGTAIRLGPLATTRRACPAALMDQERRYLQALARATGLHMEGPRLVLTDESGTALVRYARLEATAPPLPVRP